VLATERVQSDRPSGELTRLLQQCAAGDRSAFRALYDAEAGRLHGLALRITRQPSLAADAVHDTFLQVWQNAVRFDPARGSAEAWLTGLLRFRAIDVLRKRPQPMTDIEAEEIADPDPGPMDRLMTTAEGEALHRCLGGLEAQHRRVIVLAFVQGLSHSDLAAHLATPLGTVKSWIRRGLIALRSCLEA
jgi:RNA polymerase sigma-70 factor (ECF subfamily)